MTAEHPDDLRRATSRTAATPGHRPGRSDDGRPDEDELLAAFDRLSPQGSLRWGFDDAMRRIEPARPRLGRRRRPVAGPARRPVGAGAVGPHRPAVRRRRGRRAGRHPGRRRPGGRRRRRDRGQRRPVRRHLGCAAIPGRPGRAARGAASTRSGSKRPSGRHRCPIPSEWVDAGRRAGWAGRHRRHLRWWWARRATGRWSRPCAGRSRGGGRRAPGGGRLAGRSTPPDLPATRPRRSCSPRWRPHLRRMPADSVAGVVLVGCVDRLDLAGKVGLLEQSVRVTRPGGTVVVLATDQSAWDERLPAPARDLAPGRPLHPETWSILLRRAGALDVRCGTDPDRAPSTPWWPRVRDGDRERRPPVRAHAPPARRGGGAHPGPAAPVGEAGDPIRRSTPRSPIRAPPIRPGHYLDYESEAEPGDVLVYQFATESAIAGWLAGRPEPVVINYHSITPPAFFRRWNNGITRLQVGAQLELACWPRGPRWASPCPGSTRRSCVEAGCPRTTVIPVANVAGPPVEPDPRALERLRARAPGPRPAVAVGGRLAPNKAHHQTIAALFVARATSDPDARLTVVGAPSEPAYAAALGRYAAALGLADAVEFVRGISDAELAAHYRTPTSWSCCPSTRDSACPWSRPWARGSRSSPSTPAR